MKRLLLGSPLVFLFASALLAQDASTTPELSGAAAAGILGGVCIFYIILIAIWLFVAIWIMKDSKKRNSPNRTLVVVLGWLHSETPTAGQAWKNLPVIPVVPLTPGNIFYVRSYGGKCLDFGPPPNR